MIRRGPGGVNRGDGADVPVEAGKESCSTSRGGIYRTDGEILAARGIHWYTMEIEKVYPDVR